MGGSLIMFGADFLLLWLCDKVRNKFATLLWTQIMKVRDTNRCQLSWFLSVTFTETLWFHDLSPLVSATFMICVHDFSHEEVSV